jgi:hypothetical protein
MSVETLAESVIAVLKTPGGTEYHFWNEAFPRLREWINDPVHRHLMNQENLIRYFKDLPKFTAAWLARIQYLRVMNPVYLEVLKATVKDVAFHSALGKIAANEAVVAHSARMAALNATAAASKGTLVVGAGTTILCVAVPVVAMLAVQLALGAPYYEARQKARKDGYASGFSKGFIMGLLKWELRFAIERFWDNAVDRNHFDESIPRIRANAHNQGLMDGRAGALAVSDDEKNDYLKALRLLTNSSTVGWTPQSDDWMERSRARQVQISYVIELASAAMKSGIIRVG